MVDFTTLDWKRLEDLAHRTGVKPEDVTRLIRQWPTDEVTPSRILLIGRRGAGIELLLGRWISRRTADAFAAAEGDALLLARKPKAVAVEFRQYALFKWPGCPVQEVLAVAVEDHIPARMAAGIGDVDLAVFVTRLGQPCHQNERKVARQLADIVPAVNVLIVGLPGEEVPADQLAEVVAFATTQLQSAGFTEGRCLSGGVWFADNRPREGSVGDAADLFTVSRRECLFARRQMGRQMLATLVDRGLEQAEQQNGRALTEITSEDQDRRSKELAHHLKQLGRELESAIERNPDLEEESLRTHATDVFRSWSAPTTVEGIWLRYCEEMRPGFRDRFLVEAKAALCSLKYRPRQEAARRAPWPGNAEGFGKQLAGGMAAGLVAWGGSQLLPGPLSLLQTPLVALAAIGGFAISSKVWTTASRSARSRPAHLAEESPLPGWQQVVRRLLAWFAENFEPGQPSLISEWREFKERFAPAE